MRRKQWWHVQPGDYVTRQFGDDRSNATMILKVTDVSSELIICGPWEFDRSTGAEVDDLLEWGPKYGHSGSFIVDVSKYPPTEEG